MRYIDTKSMATRDGEVEVDDWSGFQQEQNRLRVKSEEGGKRDLSLPQTLAEIPTIKVHRPSHSSSQKYLQ